MPSLCQGLNALSRSEAERLYTQRLNAKNAPTLAGPLANAVEMQDSDWLDALDCEDFEHWFGGPDDTEIDADGAY